MLLPGDPILDTPGAQASEGAVASTFRGMGWTTLDQALSSFTNFGITVVAARELNRADFGAFGLAFSLALVVIGVVRSFVTEPLLARPDLTYGTKRESTFGGIAAAVLGLGAVASLMIATAGVVLGDVAGRALIALAVILPGLCLQDAWRFCFISERRPQIAVVNDGAWLAGLVVAVLTIALHEHASPVLMLVIWGCSGTAAGVLGFLQARVTPKTRAGWAWLWSQRSVGALYCLEYVTGSAASQIALVGLGALAGLSALGAVRGAQTFFGPLVVLFGGLFLATVPLATRMRADAGRLRRLILVISAGVACCALMWTVVGLVLPSPFGRELFGDTWDTTRPLILPIGLSFIASGLAAGAIVGLRSLEAARASLQARLLTLPLLVGGPLAGGLAAKATGFALGLAGALLCSTLLYWFQFLRITVPSRP